MTYCEEQQHFENRLTSTIKIYIILICICRERICFCRERICCCLERNAFDSQTHSENVHINTRAKGNPVKAVREGSIIFRFERPASRKSANTEIAINSHGGSATCVKQNWTLDNRTGICIHLWALDWTLKWNSSPEQCINAPGWVRMNFRKLTPNGPILLLLELRITHHKVSRQKQKESMHSLGFACYIRLSI